MTNKTLYVVLASLLIVLLGFGSFYLLKIRPMQQALALAQQNTTMYQQLTAANQKNYKKQKEKAKQNAAAKKNKINADKVNKRILPADPNLESFLVDYQSKAAKYGVTIDTVSRASASDNGNSAAVNAAASNSGSTASESSEASASNRVVPSASNASGTSSGSSTTASSTTQNAGSSSAQNSVASAASALHADNLAITLTAPSQANITLFVGYLESLKRLLVITNYTMQASEQAVTTDSSSAASSSSTNSSGDSTSTNSSSSDSSSAVPTIPIVQATMTLTLFSAK